MTPRSLLTLTLALVMLLVPATGVVANAEDRSNPNTAFLGIDGLLYNPALPVVRGVGDQLFYGPDFDLACGYGDRLASGIRDLSKLARIIEKSGRRVVFTVVPNKSTALNGMAEALQLPHGTCDQAGLRQQRKLLDQYSDPRYLALPRLLSRDKRQMYWNTDLHWTSLGASVFTEALATKLDPELGKHQSYRIGSLTGLGGLNALLHIAQPETVPIALPPRDIKVIPRKVNADRAYDHTWHTRSPQRTWPGRTLVIGDSMLAVSLSTLRPIFRHGRFLWLGHVAEKDIVRAIAASDTVVFETIQLFVPVVELGTKQFRSQVKRALRMPEAPRR